MVYWFWPLMCPRPFGKGVEPMTKYQFAMLVLALLQVLIGVAALLK